MKKYAKKGIIFSLAGVGLLLCGITTAHEKKIQPILTTNKIKYAEDVSSVTSSSTSDGTTYTDETGKTYVLYTDENGNGVPDALENLIANSTLDQTWKDIFQVVLSASSAIVTLFYLFWKVRQMIKRNGEEAKSATDLANKTNKSLSEANKAIENTGKDVSSLVAIVNNLTSKIDELSKANEELSKTNTELTKGYSSVSTRLDVLAQNDLLMSSTAENVKNGNAAKVANNVKGVLEYGKYKDQSKGE